MIKNVLRNCLKDVPVLLFIFIVVGATSTGGTINGEPSVYAGWIYAGFLAGFAALLLWFVDFIVWLNIK